MFIGEFIAIDITGTKTFENYDKSSKEKGFAGAAYFNSDIDVYGLVNQSIGTGLVVFSKAGFVKEELVQFDKEIGYAGSEKFVRTNVLSIRYANKGIHATPVHPSKYKDTINFLKKREILINDQKRKNIGNLPAVRHHQPVRVFRCFYTNIQSFLRKVKILLKKLKKRKKSPQSVEDSETTS